MSEILKYLKFQINHNTLFETISDIEKILFKLNKIDLKQSLFICGMPRSGTTFITHLIHSSDEYSSFKYKDLPFYKIPILWSYFSPLFYGNQKKIKRQHGDNLLIDKFSPDAFEELIWKQIISNYDENGYWQYIDKNSSNLKLDNLDLFIKKIIYLYKNKNYLSKNNNNIFRVDYLLNKFPNSKVIIVIRNPIDTAISLARVHLKFLKIHQKNNKFSEELKFLGHYEFGYYRKLFNLNDNGLNKDIIQNSNQIKIYLKKCEELNSFIINKYLDHIKNKKILIVNYDNLKNFEDLGELFSNLDITNINLIKKYFKESFIIKTKNYNKKINHEKYFRSFNILKKFSLV